MVTCNRSNARVLDFLVLRKEEILSGSSCDPWLSVYDDLPTQPQNCLHFASVMHSGRFHRKGVVPSTFLNCDNRDSRGCWYGGHPEVVMYSQVMDWTSCQQSSWVAWYDLVKEKRYLYSYFYFTLVYSAIIFLSSFFSTLWFCKISLCMQSHAVHVLFLSPLSVTQARWADERTTNKYVQVNKPTAHERRDERPTQHQIDTYGTVSGEARANWRRGALTCMELSYQEVSIQWKIRSDHRFCKFPRVHRHLP